VPGPAAGLKTLPAEAKGEEARVESYNSHAGGLTTLRGAGDGGGGGGGVIAAHEVYEVGGTGVADGVAGSVDGSDHAWGQLLGRTGTISIR